MFKNKFSGKKGFGIIILIIFLLSPLALTSSYLFNGDTMKKNTIKEEGPYPPIFDLNDKDKEWVEDKLAKMTLREKCAQMVMPWVLGNYSSEDSAEIKRVTKLVKELKVGGLIFFKGDILNEALIINKMQKLSDVPLLIASDFERGLAMRLTDALEFPYNMAVAATGEPRLAYEMGKAISIEERAMGVHQNYAPVADVNNNAENPIINIRAFSEDQNIVSEYCKAFIEGTEAGHSLSTAKHFPGHGNTKIDSHKEMPVIGESRKELERNELVPFEASIAAGVSSVMVGHLAVPALDSSSTLPATLSKKIITDYLKKKLGFKGLVVTDAMNMSAVTNDYSVVEATVKAIKAGNDILLMPPDEEVAINAIVAAVDSGEININQVDESVRKILAAKKWLQLDKNKYSDLNELPKIISNKSHKRLAQEIADKSITLVKDAKQIFPVDPAKVSKVACITITEAEDTDADLLFQNAVEESFSSVMKILISKKSRKRDYSRAYQKAKQADLILIPSFIKVKAYQGTVAISEKNADFIKKLLNLKAPSVIFSFGNPYLLSVFPKAKAYACAYGDSPVSQSAALKALLGEINIQGKLPVSIPDTKYKLGDGIFIPKTSLTFISDEEDSNYNFTEVDKLMKSGVSDSVFPGGVLLIGKGSSVIFEKAYGNFTYDTSSTPMRTDAIFDLASLSKVIGTTSAAMMLCDKGKLKLSDKVYKYLPAFNNNGKDKITIKNLLVHNSGLIAYRNYMKLYKTKEEVLNSIMNEQLQYPVGSKTIYSDLNMIVLQQVIEKITGMGLDEFLNEKLFLPLKMTRTMYNPPKELWYYCPPTTVKPAGKKNNRGVVHDGNAFILGGVSGHAGLFSTAEDLAVFAQLMLQEGSYGKKQFIKSSTIKKWTQPVSKKSSRGIGWDTNALGGTSAGNLFSKNSFGHTGYTGTSIWIDKDRQLFAILLTNRVYPDENNTKIIDFRPVINDAIIKATDLEIR